VRGQAAEAGLLSDEHFTVDGTLLEAWASLKSSSAGTNRRRSRLTIRATRPWTFMGIVEERHPPVHHGSGRPTRAQGPRERGEALLRRACPAGQSARLGGQCVYHRRHRDGRA
jgi:hypothetical protein